MKQVVKKIKKKSNNIKSKNETEDCSFVERNDLNLNKELHSLDYYINDKEELINQIFSIIKVEKLVTILPPILKDLTIDELKSQCLEELYGMSSKRILHILRGEQLLVSSTDSCDSFSDIENDILYDNKQYNKRCSPGDNSPAKKLKTTKNYEELANPVLNPLKQTNVKVKDVEERDKAIKPCENSMTTNESAMNDSEHMDKEILELEMRARAIKALLKYQSEELDDI